SALEAMISLPAATWRETLTIVITPPLLKKNALVNEYTNINENYAGFKTANHHFILIIKKIQITIPGV
ncbi:MAG: hypothetical protein WCU00_14045, partial [Candidatus Latescibacterota bacterium]